MTAAGARSAENRRLAAATLTSGIHTADGQFSLYLVKAPWCDGGVFTLNPAKAGKSISHPRRWRSWSLRCEQQGCISCAELVNVAALTRRVSA